jgi:hypothetical protein
MYQMYRMYWVGLWSVFYPLSLHWQSPLSWFALPTAAPTNGNASFVFTGSNFIPDSSRPAPPVVVLVLGSPLVATNVTKNTISTSSIQSGVGWGHLVRVYIEGRPPIQYPSSSGANLQDASLKMSYARPRVVKTVPRVLPPTFSSIEIQGHDFGPLWTPSSSLLVTYNGVLCSSPAIKPPVGGLVRCDLQLTPS